MKYEYLFFDLDGTLTDPGLGITNSIIYSLKKFNIEVKEREKLYPFIGPPLMESYNKYFGFDEEKCKKAVCYYREYFSVKGLFENKVYDGIIELLEELNQKGFKPVLASSKPEEYVRRILKHFEMDNYFYEICGSTFDASLETKADVINEALRRRDITDKSKVVMIGDRLHDIEGAKEVGIDSVGVLWGYGGKEELEKYGAQKIVSNIEELKEYLLSSNDF